MIVLPLAGAVVAWVVLLVAFGCTANGHRWSRTHDRCDRCGVSGEHLARWGRRRERLDAEVFGG